jgi:sulfite exporter TauE/SafE
MIRIIFEGFFLGLSTGAYCISACLVFFMPYLLVEARQNVRENLKQIGSFMGGRLIAYIGFAVAMGAIETTHKEMFTPRFTHLSLVVVSLIMFFYALSNHFADAKICSTFIHRFRLVRIPFFLGLFSGLSPCMPFLVGATRLWTLNNIGQGVILFAAFFVGTSLYMTPLIFVGYINRFERVKRIGILVALLSSLWFFFVGISGLLMSPKLTEPNTARGGVKANVSLMGELTPRSPKDEAG